MTNLVLLTTLAAVAACIVLAFSVSAWFLLGLPAVCIGWVIATLINTPAGSAD